MFAHGVPSVPPVEVELSRIANERTHIENERNRIAQEVDLLLAQRAQPSASTRKRKRIRSRLGRLTGLRGRLDDKEAELRWREADLLRILHGVLSAGSPASSSREIGVEEYAGEVSNSDLGGTSTNLSEFGALMLNDDTPYTIESGDGVEDLPGEVKSSEPVDTITDLSNFQALALNDSPESANRVVMHVDTVESGMLDSTIAEQSARERKKPSEIPQKYWPPKNMGDILFARRQAKKEYEESRAQSLQALGQYSYASQDEIALHAKKWMKEEVMVAFKRYISSEDDLKDVEYEFEELLIQCFNVEHYFKIFHHFNFNVKIRKRGSTDWTSITFFAEVISILQKKHYVCYPLLDPNENGQCYACQNQKVFKLRHPAADIFECGNEDTTFPYYYENKDSDESHPVVGGSESDDDMS